MGGRHLYMYAALKCNTESIHKEIHQEPTHIYYMALCIMAECHEQAWNDIEEV
jgi:hypothetical protein